MATQLVERLRADPERFASIVEEHSDDVFAGVGGDLGPRSNLSGTLDVATRLTLATLKPMEISGVLDEVNGYAIVQRLPPRAIERRAFEAFVVTHGAAPHDRQDGQPHRTEAEARELAAQVARSLSERPGEFEAARAQFCAEGGCGGLAALTTDGSTFPNVYRDLARLPIGAVSTRIELWRSGFMVYRRVAADEPPTIARVFDLEKHAAGAERPHAISGPATGP